MDAQSVAGPNVTICGNLDPAAQGDTYGAPGVGPGGSAGGRSPAAPLSTVNGPHRVRTTGGAARANQLNSRCGRGQGAADGARRAALVAAGVKSLKAVAPRSGSLRIHCTPTTTAGMPGCRTARRPPSRCSAASTEEGRRAVAHQQRGARLFRVQRSRAGIERGTARLAGRQGAELQHGVAGSSAP